MIKYLSYCYQYKTRIPDTYGKRNAQGIEKLSLTTDKRVFQVLNLVFLDKN